MSKEEYVEQAVRIAKDERYSLTMKCYVLGRLDESVKRETWKFDAAGMERSFDAFSEKWS